MITTISAKCRSALTVRLLSATEPTEKTDGSRQLAQQLRPVVERRGHIGRGAPDLGPSLEYPVTAPKVTWPRRTRPECACSQAGTTVFHHEMHALRSSWKIVV